MKTYLLNIQNQHDRNLFIKTLNEVSRRKDALHVGKASEKLNGQVQVEEVEGTVVDLIDGLLEDLAISGTYA